MKIHRIFIKNVKVVSRNWIYFVVLFLFPFFLIVASALLLNSNDIKNLRVGIIDETLETSIQIDDIGRSAHYSTLDECLLDLTSFEISVCIHSKKRQNETFIDVYLDNSRKLIEDSTKQMILEKVFEKQSDFIETTSSTVESKLAVFSSSLNDAKIELGNAELELEKQEQTLVGYKRNLTIIKSEFDIMYSQLKDQEENITLLKYQIEQSQLNIERNVSVIRQDVDNARSNIDLLREYLLQNLSAPEFSNAATFLDLIYESLDEIDLALDNIESDYPDTEVVSLLTSIEFFIQNLDKIKALLDSMEKDLDDSLARTREAKEKVATFKDEIAYLETEIVSIESIGENEGISLRFNDAFSITPDLVVNAFPYVISIIITFSSLVLSNKFILTQVNNPSYLRENISPTRDSSFLVADYLINIFFVAIQVAVLMFIGLFWFEISIDRMPLFIFIIFLASSILIFIGLSIGYMIRAESLSVLFTIFFVMFLNIFSDILVPSILSGPFLRFFISLNPFVILNNSLRDVLLLGKSATQIADSILRFCILFVSSASIAYIAKKASKDSILQ